MRGKGMSDKTVRYLSGNMYYKGEKVEFVTGNTMTDKEPKTASEVLDNLECLLEKIEDGSSDLWDVEVSDLDGSACVVLNTARAKESIIEYAEAYALKKCSECKDFCARARENCEDREGR